MERKVKSKQTPRMCTDPKKVRQLWSSSLTMNQVPEMGNDTFGDYKSLYKPAKLPCHEVPPKNSGKYIWGPGHTRGKFYSSSCGNAQMCAPCPLSLAVPLTSHGAPGLPGVLPNQPGAIQKVFFALIQLALDPVHSCFFASCPPPQSPVLLPLLLPLCGAVSQNVWKPLHWHITMIQCIFIMEF